MALIEKLNAIGDAIRAKTGKSEKLTLDEMPIEIASLSDAGGGETMVGTWIFNEVLDLPEFDFYFNFVLTNVADSPPFYNLYSEGDGTLYYFDVDDTDHVPYENGAWIYPDWRTITITEEPTDAGCIAWLKANGRKAAYEDGFAEGEKAILSAFVDWSASTTSTYCYVEFYNNSDYYAHMYCYIADPGTWQTYEEDFVIPPQDMYYIDSEEEIGTSALSGEWLVNASIKGFSKDGER